ncbi:pilus assembly protein PilM [Candidatus Babeliales bacterium]|nr:pilus assembly protein PilM [Candidatus Babeliales bacterium]
MFRDIITPCRVGQYFLYPQKILSFEINTMMVNATLIEFSGDQIILKNTQSITLKDFSIQAQTNALKKIASNIGAYDTIITVMPSTNVVFKELELPFIGHDNLQMILAYEVEALLPFSLDDAVLDFIITQENYEKNSSKVLVAAVRKEDLNQIITLFEKAELTLDTITIDMFTLQALYSGLFKIVSTPQKQYFNINVQSSSIINLWKKIHTKFFKKTSNHTPVSNSIQYQPKTADLFIDIGFDVTRVLYFQDHELITIRMIPTGINDIAQHISQNNGPAYYDVIQNMMTSQNISSIQDLISKELNILFEEINRTLNFFEKQQMQSYLTPEKILLSGFLTTVQNFQTQAQSFFAIPIQILHTTDVIQKLNIKTKQSYENVSIINLATALFQYFNQTVNLLKNIVQKKDNRLLNKQIVAIIIITVTAIGLTFWKSSTNLALKETAYNSSKRQFIQAIQERMHIDLAQEKNVKIIVEKAETKLKNEKNLWLGFAAQQEHSILEYLQDLSVHIDRSTLNLVVKNMHLDHDKVTMSATLKDYADITTLQDELAELQLLQSTDTIRDLAFTLQFKPKQTKSKDEPKGNQS